MIAAPHVRSVGHIFTYLYTLDDDSDCPMDYETLSLSKVFPLMTLWFQHTDLCKNEVMFLLHGTLLFIKVSLLLYQQLQNI